MNVCCLQAKARLILSHVAVDGSGAVVGPSRFLREIPAQLVERSMRY